VGTPPGNLSSLLGSPRRRSKNNIKVDLRKIECEGRWIKLAQDLAQ